MTEVGISIIPYWDSLEQRRELVRVADEGGLALVGIEDHPHPRATGLATTRSRVVALIGAGAHDRFRPM